VKAFIATLITEEDFRAILKFEAFPTILCPMNELSPIVSEFDTVEQAESYEKWLRAKVARSLADKRPPIPHDEAMAEAQKIIDARKQR
jgi:hypothetical protein